MKSKDHVGRVMDQWARERPDLDVSPQGVIGRLHRIGMRLTEELVAEYAKFGLGEGEFDVLATLRRGGAPYRLTPTEIAERTMVSSGAVSKRVDRCERHGWVTREPSVTDGRGRVVVLTGAGKRLIDRAFTAHIANEHRLLEGLSRRQRDDLARLLEQWARQLGV
ncbi:MarR family winged helix-turn-helix transcriptional regulator [Nocardioides antri]|uniref:MarR family transcriptional regulator n=1 Tax=Nocardioides antri TaxID=2607659 RepID=A0A5B1M533_9ACTN|nr:MarR family transcriptional regulator [Nocardioides antri]KAA1427786.1 MarR family transcriptional regulator [Nocardioides antri]